ncbi:MAG: hypothetical protein U0744_19735 [Gemmataceae bacterium]
MVRAISALLAMACWILPNAFSHAQGFIENVEPPVLQVGKTTRVTLVGSKFGKPLDVWTSLPKGAIQAKPGPSDGKRATFDVTVAADAPVGVAGLRLATEDGLTNAALFLIDDLPTQPATTSSKVTLPASLWGRFREGEVERFAIDVKAGQRVAFEAVGNRLGKDVDPLLVIRDPKGRVVVERDNDAGFYFDFRFEHAFKSDGPHTIEFRDARFQGNEHAMFVLRMGKFPADQVVAPMSIASSVGPKMPALGMFFGVGRAKDDEGSAWWPQETTMADAITVHREPGDSMETAPLAKVPGVLCGILRKPRERQIFKVELTKGQKIVFRGEAKAFNSPAEIEIAVLDAAGKELRRATENQQEEITLDFQANQPGIYGIAVRDTQADGGPSFAYRIEAANPGPRIAAIAEVEGLTVPRGSHQPIPILVTRSDYAGPISLSLVGSPTGVTLSPQEIPDGKNAVVCDLLASDAAPLGIHTVQILAKPATVADAQPILVRTKPLIDRQLVNVDLIVHALREDQRRLPPSVADRFAVQITPPSPFDFDLPESQRVLNRYQHVPFPIVTKRAGGFAEAITFDAKGGQLADKEEGRTRVYAELPTATAEKQMVTGSVHSRILTNLQKHRVEVTGRATDKGRTISLTRTFELDVKTAFAVTAEPALVKIEPGNEAVITLTLERGTMFDGPVRLEMSPTQAATLPSELVFPAGKSSLTLPIKIDADRNPGRHNVQIQATATVNGFEEEQRTRFEIEIFKPAPPKKK